MKARSLAKLLGLDHIFNYESKLYNDKHSTNGYSDIIDEKKLITRQGHLD